MESTLNKTSVLSHTHTKKKKRHTNASSSGFLCICDNIFSSAPVSRKELHSIFTACTVHGVCEKDISPSTKWAGSTHCSPSGPGEHQPGQTYPGCDLLLPTAAGVAQTAAGTALSEQQYLLWHRHCGSLVSADVNQFAACCNIILARSTINQWLQTKQILLTLHTAKPFLGCKVGIKGHCPWISSHRSSTVPGGATGH